MSLLGRLRSWARTLLRREAADREMDAELRSHIELHAEDLIRSGMPRDEAFRQARLAFGGLDRAKEECRDAIGVSFIESVLRDISFGLRMLRKNSGFTAVAILTLALGIGANAAIFTVLDTVVIRPLPYAQPDRLVALWESNPRERIDKAALTEGAFPVFRAEAQSFERLAAYNPGLSGSNTIWGTSQQVKIGVLSAGLAEVLRVQPIRGRSFTPDDENASAKGFAPVALLSHSLWQSYFKADPDIIGKTLAVNLSDRKQGYTIIGVMPEGFVFPYPLFPDKPDLWMVDRFPSFVQGTVNGAFTIGRLKPGVTVQQADAELATISQNIARQAPAYKGARILVEPLTQEAVSGVSSILFVLFGAAGLLLVLACANVGNLMLTRGAHRVREMAVRTALGASRAALIRQTLVEAAMIGLGGGAVGILLAEAITKGFVVLIPANLYVPRLNEVSLGLRPLMYTAALSLAAAVMAGLLPALRLSRPSIDATLKSGGIAAGERASLFRRPGSALLVVELALAIPLLIGGLLFARSLQRLLAVDLSFEPSSLLAEPFSIGPGESLTQPEEIVQFGQVINRVSLVPGVKEAALVSPFPIGSPYLGRWRQVGATGASADYPISAQFGGGSPKLFEIMNMSLQSGRLFDSSDTLDSPKVAVINDVMARRYWPGSNPVGLKLEGPPSFMGTFVTTIIGVVSDSRRFGTGQEALPTLFGEWTQDGYPRGTTIVVRSAGDARAVSGGVHEAIKAALPSDSRIDPAHTGNDIVAQNTARLKFESIELATFAAVALLLSALGVYGLTSYLTARRTREIGIRVAVGAQYADVIRLIVAQGMKLSLIAIALGTAAAFGLTRVMRSLLFDVAPTDAQAFAGAVILLAGAAFLGCYIPARRASRVDPMVALRHE